MALSVIQRSNTGVLASFSTASTVMGSATTAGSLLVVLVHYETGGVSVSTVTDTGGVNNYVIAGTPANKTEVWYCPNAASIANGGTVTASFTGSSTYGIITVYEIGGADTVSPYDTSSSGTAGSGTAIATGTLSLATSNEIILAWAAGYSDTSVAAGTGYTGFNYGVIGDSGLRWYDGYHIVSANEAATATQGGSASWSILAAAFKAAGAGPPAGGFFARPYYEQQGGLNV